MVGLIKGFTCVGKSWKKPIYRISKKITELGRRALRRKVKAELKKPDPNPLIADATTRTAGFEDYGTRIDMRYWDDEEGKEKASRK